MIPPCVIWVDPGGMTGIAWYAQNVYRGRVIGSGHQFYVQELDFAGACHALETIMSWYGPLAWVGWERYDIDTRRPQKNAHTAIEPIGVCRHLAIKHGCHVIEPAFPGQRKVATMDMLKAIGWWTAGKDDAQSAAQHLLAWLMRTGNVPPQIGVMLAETRA